MMNFIVNVKDRIDFGALKGEHFYWIYRMKISYLEWLIENTPICFYNLSDFYNFGKPKQIKDNAMQDKIELILAETLENPPMYKPSSLVFITIKNFGNLIEKGNLIETDFEEVDYKFSDFLININAEKLKNAEPYYSKNKLLETTHYFHNFYYEDEKFQK